MITYIGPCVYLLHGNRYYLGSTNNLPRRLIEHQRGEYSTKRIGTRHLLGYVPCETLKEARDIERTIKKKGYYKENLHKLGMIYDG